MSLLDSARKNIFRKTAMSKCLLQKVMNTTKDSMVYYDAYEAYATIYLLNNQYDSGIIMKRKIESFLKNESNTYVKKRLLASINNSYGVYYSLINNPDSSIIYLMKALYLQYDKSEFPNIYINLSDQYKAKGNLSTAAFYLRKALSISDSLNLNEYKFPLYYGLGDIYLELRDFKQADEYYLRAEKDYKNRRFDEKVLFCNNRGNYYYYKQEYSNALLWFKRAENYLRNTKHDYFKSLIYTNLADIYLNLNKADSCKFYLDHAEPYFKSLNHKSALFYINAIRIGLATVQNNFCLANQLKNKIKSSKGIEPNIKLIRIEYLEKLSLKERDYKNAYFYIVEHRTLSDSLRNDATQKRIVELDMHYKEDSTLMKKNLLIEQQKAEVKTFKLSSYIWILISILSVSGAIFTLCMIKKKNDSERDKYIDKILKLKISNIRNRISPHFMFNVLNNEMQGLDEEKKNRLYTLAQLLRKSLEMAEQISIKLSNEIEFAKAYIELNRYRIGNNFKMTWNISPEINPDKIMIIPMMLQIPIENALKHGLANIEGEKRLTVEINKELLGIQINIIDNGTGYHPNAATTCPGTGTGLKVLMQSIQILNSKNAHKITASVQNRNKIPPEITGTKVEIFIPYNFKFNYK